MKRTLMILMAAVVVGGTSPTLWADDDPQVMARQQLEKDKKSIQEAQQAYQRAILEHGQSSEEARKAMDRLDSAKNKLRIDQLRVKQLQEAQNTMEQMGTSGASGTSDSLGVAPSTPSTPVTPPSSSY